MDYESLLKRGMARIPEDARTAGRFHIAKPEVEKAGAKSILTNFLEIAGGLDREPEHLLKFLLKQLATKGGMEGQRLVVLGVFSADAIEKKLESYVKQYVMCPKCNRPDTKLIKEHDALFIRCDACGAKTQVPKV